MYNVNNTHIKYCRCMTSGIKNSKIFIILTSIHIVLILIETFKGFEYRARELFSEKFITPIDKIYLYIVTNRQFLS